MRDLNVAFGRRARFRRHLKRMSATFARLQTAECSEPNVLAVLAVESFYRPRPLRGLEYAVWMLRSLVDPSWRGGLSVGIAQMQLRHWRDLGLLDSIRFSRRRLARVRDPELNYEACRRYLSARGVLDEPDPDHLSAAYAGGKRPYFAVMLDEARALGDA